MAKTDGAGRRGGGAGRTEAGPAQAGRAGGAGTSLSLEAEEFLTWLAVERGRAANTLAAYRRDLLGLSSSSSPSGEPPWPASTRPTVQDYVAALRREKRAPATVARALVAVRVASTASWSTKDS